MRGAFRPVSYSPQKNVGLGAHDTIRGQAKNRLISSINYGYKSCTQKTCHSDFLGIETWLERANTHFFCQIYFYRPTALN